MTTVAITVGHEGRLTLLQPERERLHLTPGIRVIVEIGSVRHEDPLLTFAGS